MLVNKYPESKAEIKMNIPGLSGKAKVGQLHQDNASKGPEIKSMEMKDGMKMILPPLSVTSITLD